MTAWRIQQQTHQEETGMYTTVAKWKLTSFFVWLIIITKLIVYANSAHATASIYGKIPGPSDFPGGTLLFDSEKKSNTVARLSITQISGQINEDMYTKLVAEYRKKPFEYTLVDSVDGGASGHAMNIGYFIRDHNIKIVIDGFCLSSCANYILPAAKLVIMTEHGVVGWHGSMKRSAATAERRHELDIFFPPEQLKELRDNENEYFEKIGVDAKICVCGLLLPDMQSGAKKLFYYTPEIMEQFGIQNIIYLEGKKQWLARMAKMENYYLAQPCTEEDLAN